MGIQLPFRNADARTVASLPVTEISPFYNNEAMAEKYELEDEYE